MPRSTTHIVLPLALAMAALLACNTPGTLQGTPLPAGGQPSITPSVTMTNTAPAPTEAPPTAPPPSATLLAATPTTGPAPSATVSPQGPVYGALIYQTDFTAGWPEVVSGEQGRSTPADGGYRFDIGPRWGHYVYTAAVAESALYVEVQATPLTCPPGDSGYGLMFHLLSADQFRYAVITCEGGYIMRELSESSTRTLTSGTLPEGTNPAAGLHRIGVRALDNRLTLYVDGVQIAQVEVTDMPAGEVGPYVKTEAEGVSILFTRLEVYQAR